MSKKASAGGLEVTLFQRLVEKWGDKVVFNASALCCVH
jgi:hypothetical protein